MNETKKEESFDIEELYGKVCKMKPEEYIEKQQISIMGLSEEEARKRQKQYGENQIKQKRAKSWYHYLWQSLRSPFNVILLGITIVLFYTDVYLAQVPNYANILVIFVLVTASTLLDFFETYQSNQAAEKLKSMVQTTANVLRNGKEEKVPFNKITLGDILILTAGDMVPADGKVLESKDLYLTQSTLTGESDSVRKVEISEHISEKEIESITELDTICFMGTNVTSGYAKVVVIKIADETYLGKIAHTLSLGKPATSFQKGIKNISQLLIRFMLVMIPITFLLNQWKHGIVVAFTFSVAIAIGITPLLLPVILSSSLAKGAKRMSKKKTIIKKLDSIQSFGAMNVLCTDKTGTLTEDKIVLETYLNIEGKEDKQVLQCIYLNSFFQTGLKGNMDEAIVKRGREEGLEEFAKAYQKVDEVPFDFSRRRLSIAVTDGKQKQFITKGAVEEILGICTKVELQGRVEQMTSEIKQKMKQDAKKLNEQGLRVIAVCKKSEIEGIQDFDVADEKDMTLIGFAGFLDPPKESAKQAIQRLNEAGIRVMVLTGDNEEITKVICGKVGIRTKRIVQGAKLDKLSDLAVLRILKDTNVLVKLSPIQKARIIRILEQAGNIVGYMGDGINDTPSLTNAEVGISVDTAVQVAKESADIILLEKDLNVLVDGVMEGRKTFGNLLKYIKLAVSFNFGEVTSVLIASMLLPFFPITPIQLLVQSLLYDIGQLTLPLDHVDPEYLEKPRKWNIQSLKRFMLYMGPTSSIFDLIVFATLWFGFGLRIEDAALFQTIWFSYGVVSNLIGMHVIRTAKVPFVQSHASKWVYVSSILISIIAILVPFMMMGKWIGLVALPSQFIGLILVVPILYCFVASFVKRLYIKKYGEWL